jgi:hypothetical protein
LAKPKSKSSGGLAVRRVTSTKERNQGGFFMRLKTDEWLKGYALFTPDPEAANNPGYFEYFEHYDKSNNSYVPCAGDDCYMCELGDNPSVRALTLWYFPDNANGEKLKVLKLNGYMIRDFAEIEAEEGGVLGKKFRVKRLSDKGEYRISPQTDKKLPAKEIKALLKSAMEKTANDNKKSTTPIDFEAITLRQLKAALEKVDAASSLEDTDEDDEDDDEDDEPKDKARKGKKEKENDEDDDDDDEDEDDEDDEDEDEDADDDDDDEDESDDDDDSDDEDDEDEDDDDDDDDEEAEESTEISGVKFEVVTTKEADETITVKMDGKNRKLWLAEGVDADWDVVKKGAEITIDADTDEEGDYVITKLKVKKPKADTKKTGGKKTGSKKTGGSKKK